MSRGLCITGGIGMIMLSIAAVFYSTMEWVYDNTGIPGDLARMILLVASVLVGVSLLLAGLGWLGLSHSSAKGLATICFVLALVFGWWLLIADAVRVVFYDIGLNISPIVMYTVIGHNALRLHHILLFLAHLFLGILFILWGVTAILAAKDLRVKGLGIAAGVLFLIAGIGYCINFFGMITWTLFYIPLGAILLGIAAILMAVALFMPPATKAL